MSLLDEINKLVEEWNGGPLPSAPRDFVPCRFCGGGSMDGPGCIGCFSAREKKKKELDEEYKRQFPNGPQPMAKREPKG